MDNIKLCTLLQVPPGQLIEADILRIQHHPLSDFEPTTAGIPPGPGGLSHLAMPVATKWKNGSTLRVKILNGSTIIKRKIEQYANEWTRYANIRFRFVDSGDAEIRVNVDLKGASNSYRGTHNLLIGQRLPTMNFGWLQDDSSETVFSSVILHEFGHALGLIHEHTSPAAEIKWNKPLVYQYYSRAYGWDKDMVDRAVLSVHDKAATEFSAFDPHSIMIYSISSILTTDGFFVDWATGLSEMDKAFIHKLYPLPDDNLAEFNTLDVREADKPAQSTVRTKKFSQFYDQPPSIVFGLNWIEIASGANIRINAFAQNLTNKSVDVHLDTWSDTTLYSAGCTWHLRPTFDLDFQMGQFSTMDDHPWQNRQIKTSRKITFSRPYSAQPKVIVWLNQLDISYNTVWKVQATATDITAEGFTVNIDSGDETWLCSATAAWVAYPSDKKGIFSGSFDTISPQPQDQDPSTRSGSVDFPVGTFGATPKVLVAFNSLDADYRQDLRVKVLIDSVSAKGINWQISSWGNTALNFARASYIALS